MKNLLSVAGALLLFGCSSSVNIRNSDILDRSFPQVRGQSLEGKATVLPDDFLGKNTVLLIGYEMKTQFDIDRWILGLLQADVPVQIVEVPTIAGMMPQMVQRFIDSGMRSGIPKKEWASVVTVYEDAEKIIYALGNSNPRSAYVVLLDGAGKIRWFSEQGYSAGQVLELKQLVSDLG